MNFIKFHFFLITALLSFTCGAQETADFEWNNGCLSNPVLFWNNSTEGCGTASSFEWSFDDSGSGVLNSSIIENPTHIFTAAGTYNVRLVVNWPCSSSDTIIQAMTIMNGTPPTVVNDTFLIGGFFPFFSPIDEAICLVNPYNISWETTDSDSLIFDWGDGTTETVIINASPQSNVNNHTYLIDGIYNVTIIAYNNCGTDTITGVVTTGGISIGFGMSTSTICLGADVDFTNLTTYTGSGTLSYLWDFGDYEYDSVNINTIHSYTLADTFLITLTASDGNCSIDFTDTLIVTPSSLSATINSAPDCPCNEIDFSTASAAVDYAWNFGDGTTSSVQNPGIHIYGLPGAYNTCLELTDANGCKATDYSFINVCPNDTVYVSKSDNNWRFGANAGVNFNSGSPTNIAGSPLLSVGISSAISDPYTGDLLFSVGGNTNLYNSNNTILQGSAGITFVNGGLTIVPNPANDHQYYIFHASSSSGVANLLYSVVDMTLDGGLGEIVPGQLNVILTPTDDAHESFASIQIIPPATCLGGSPAEYWLVTSVGFGEYKSFRITGAGIQAPVITNLGPTVNNNWNSRNSRISPDGKLYAITGLAMFSSGTPESNQSIFLMDFDTNTGILSNHRVLQQQFNDQNAQSALEFSSNSRFLYTATAYIGGGVSTGSEAVYQFDVQNPAATPLEVYVGPTFPSGAGGNYVYHMWRADDDKIYYSRKSSNFLGVINDPNLLGTACNVNHSGHPLANTSHFGLQHIQRKLVPVLDTTFADFFADTTNCLDVTFTNLSDTLSYTDSCSYLANSDTIVTYEWDFGDGNSSAQFEPIHTYLNAGVYNVQLIVTRPFWCTSDTIIKTITLNPSPIVNAGLDQILCDDGTAVTLSAFGGASYVWDNGLTDNVAFSPSLGTVTYTVTGTDINGCIGTDQVDVTLNSLPTVDAGIDQSLCNDGTNVILSASGATNYVWDNGVVDNVGFTPTVGTTTYIVTGTDINGCTATDQVDVTSYALPSVDAGPDQSVCVSGQVTLSASGASNYFWDNGAVDNLPFTPVLGTTTYTVTATDGNGCTATDQVAIIATNNAPINAGIDTSICIGNSVTISAIGGISYNWDQGLGAGTSHNVSPILTTVYNVDGQDVNGCVGQDQITITVNPLPIVDAGIDQEVCNDGALVTLSGNGALNYVWDSGILDNIAFTPSLGTTTYTVNGTDVNGCSAIDQADVIVNPLPIVDAGLDQTICHDGTQITLMGTGAFMLDWSNGVINSIPFSAPLGTTTYTLIGIDLNGCEATDQVDVIVNPLPIVDAGTDEILCEGNAVTLSGSGASNYMWDNGITDGVEFTPVVGTTTYTVTGTDINGCIATDDIALTVETITAGFTADITNGCAPLDVTFTNQSSANSINCEWIVNEAILSGCASVSTTFNNAGVYGVTLIVTSLSGCSDTITYSNYITVQANPTAAFSFSPQNPTTEDDELIITDQSFGGTLYDWTFNGSQISTDQNPIIQLDVTGKADFEICQYVSTDFGCADSICQQISIQEEIIFYVPNAFTPDGDEYNQTFKPIISSGIDPYDYHLMIFNRWGQLLFESHNYDIGWDGTYLGRLVQDGTYAWKIEFGDKYNDARYTHIGHLNILK